MRKKEKLCSTKLVLAAIALFLILVPAMAYAAPFAYVSTDNNISVIDIASNKVSTTVPIYHPWYSKVSPSCEKVFVRDDANVIHILDTSTNKVTGTLNLGGFISCIEFNQDGTKAYVASIDYLNGDTVSVIDTSNNLVTAKVKVVNPWGIAVNQAGTRVYVMNQMSNNVSVVDTATNSVIAKIPVGLTPEGLAVTPDGTKVYVANQMSGNVSVIDTTTNTIKTSINNIPGGADGVAITADGKKAFVNNPLGVTVIDTTIDTIIDSVDIGVEERGFAVSPEGKYVYVTADYQNTLFKIDTIINKVTDTAKLDLLKGGLVVSPDGKKVLVGVQGAVAVFDTTTKAVKRVGLGSCPHDIAICSKSVSYTPIADFTANPITGSAPLKVQFTDTSKPDLGINKWEWDFNNDGIVDSTEQNPSYTYQDPGKYSVKLKVTGPGGTDDEIKIDLINATSKKPAPLLKIKAAKMISPTELGIGVLVNYPKDAPKSGTTKFNFTCMINGKSVNIPINVLKSTWPGGDWGTGCFYKDDDISDVDHKKGYLRPDTPLRINLADQNIPRFKDNIEFIINGTASYEGSSQSEVSSYSGEILLPVVVLHGYVTEIDKFIFNIPFIPKIKMLGYPYGNTVAPSCTSEANKKIYRSLFYESAYKPLTDYLVKNGYKNYTKQNQFWHNTKQRRYFTLWDPSDPNIGYSSLSFATERDLLGDMMRVTKLVKDYSYADKYNVVGHSTGGLVARYWASQNNADFNNIITVGSPLEGICKFYEEALKEKFSSHESVEKELLRTVPNGNINNTLSWFVPKWNAIDESEYKRTSTDPNPYFENTFNYPYSSDVNYHLIFGNNIPTDYSVKIKKNIKAGWYYYKNITKKMGDGYVFEESAADKDSNSNVKRYPMKLNYNHAVILKNQNVEDQILQILKGSNF